MCGSGGCRYLKATRDFSSLIRFDIWSDIKILISDNMLDLDSPRAWFYRKSGDLQNYRCVDGIRLHSSVSAQCPVPSAETYVKVRKLGESFTYYMKGDFRIAPYRLHVVERYVTCFGVTSLIIIQQSLFTRTILMLHSANFSTSKTSYN